MESFVLMMSGSIIISSIGVILAIKFLRPKSTQQSLESGSGKK